MIEKSLLSCGCTPNKTQCIICYPKLQIPFPTLGIPRSEAEIKADQNITKVDPEPITYQVEFVTGILELHLRNELEYPQISYKAQREITPLVRNTGIIWLTEIAINCRFRNETLFGSIQLIDRFAQIRSIPKNRWQLVCATAFFVISKREEGYALTANEMVGFSNNDFSKELLFLYERMMLKDLKWKLNYPTSLTFLRVWDTLIKLTDQIYVCAEYLLQISLFNYDCMSCSFSLLSASAIYLSCLMTDQKTVWGNKISKHIKYEREKILYWARVLNRHHRNEYQRDPPEAVVLKYRLKVYLEVAKLKPASPYHLE